MRVQKTRGGSKEKKILTAMIVHPQVLGRVATQWTEHGLFAADWCNIIGGWCVDYYNRYGRAPGRDVEGLFESWVDEHPNDKASAELVERLLTELAGDYSRLKKDVNPDRVIDVAGDYFRHVSWGRLIERLEAEHQAGKIDKLEKIYNSFNRVEMGAGSFVDVLHDREAVKNAFRGRTEPMVEYPDAMGDMFNHALVRDSFVAILAPEKTGKSTVLIDMAYRGLLQGRKVAFFAVGDMSEGQMMMRFMCRAAHWPWLSPGNKWPYTIRLPIFLEPPPKSEKGTPRCATPTFREKTFSKPLSEKIGLRALAKIDKRLGGGAKSSPLRLSCHPNSSINVMGVQAVLKAWDRQGWTPDVVVIDYADILAPPHGQLDTREQINTTWKQLRAMSQSMHNLVVTATQSNAEGFKEEILDRSNFSEDKRKLSHVTAMVGTNVNFLEKERQIMRFNYIVLREGEFHTRRCVHAAGCLAIANPCIKSIFA